MAVNSTLLSAFSGLLTIFLLLQVDFSKNLNARKKKLFRYLGTIPFTGLILHYIFIRVIETRV